MSRPFPDSRLTDAAIIAASVKDPTRFAEIFDRHWLAIHRYCVIRGGPAGEDIAAETFRIALDSCRRFDRSRESAAPWLYGIATNLLRHSTRSEARRVRAVLRLPLGEETDFVDGAVDRVDAEALGPQVADALGQLTAVYRDAFLLHAWADLSYEQVAEAMECSVGTVRSRISRARSSVCSALETKEMS